MTIACLGWGSLIWDDDRNEEFNKSLRLDPNKLPKDSWKTNGPCLPIEFARKSGDFKKLDRRVTLVIVPGRKRIRTLWIDMKADNVKEAKKELAKREGTGEENIGYWPLDSSDGQLKDVIGEWAHFHHLKGVVWTNLVPNWNESNQPPDDVQEVISYIQTLSSEEQKYAERYIRNSPPQINTEWRDQLQASFTHASPPPPDTTILNETSKQAQGTPSSNNEELSQQWPKEDTKRTEGTSPPVQGDAGSSGEERKRRKYALALVPIVLAVITLLFATQIDGLTRIPGLGQYLGIALVVVGGVYFTLGFWLDLGKDRKKREQDLEREREDKIKRSIDEFNLDCKHYYVKVVLPLVKEYRDREKKKRREFYGWQLAILATSATIAIINVIPSAFLPLSGGTTPSSSTVSGDYSWVRIVSTIFAGGVTVMTGLTQMLRAQELWVVFGMAYVSLESEWNQYRHETGDYDKSKVASAEDRCKKFVENFEKLRYRIADQSWIIAGKRDLGTTSTTQQTATTRS